MIGHCFSHGPVEELAGELQPELEELGRLVPGGAPLAAGRARAAERAAGRRALPALRGHGGGARRGSPAAARSCWSATTCSGPTAPTLRLLRHLARAATPERLLFVGAYRDVEAPPEAPLAGVIADLRREQALDVVALEGSTSARRSG